MPSPITLYWGALNFYYYFNNLAYYIEVFWGTTATATFYYGN